MFLEVLREENTLNEIATNYGVSPQLISRWQVEFIENMPAVVGFDYCNQLFTIEKDLEKLTPEERKIQRQERSLPVLEAYWSWIETVNVLKGSKLAEAMTYSVNQRTSLCVFLEDGRIELSNNRALKCDPALCHRKELCAHFIYVPSRFCYG